MPFDADDHISILLMHCSEPVPPFVEANPAHQVPPELETIVSKALMKNPDQRFQSTDELLSTLDQVASALAYVPNTAALPIIARSATPTPVPQDGVETPTPARMTPLATEPEIGVESVITKATEPGPGPGLSGPQIGKPRPEEVGLTPSGSFDWDTDLKLDLGVTPIGRTKEKGPRSNSIVLIAGALGLIVAILAVGAIVLFGSSNRSETKKDPPALSTPKTDETTTAGTNGVQPPEELEVDLVDTGATPTESDSDSSQNAATAIDADPNREEMGVAENEKEDLPDATETKEPDKSRERLARDKEREDRDREKDIRKPDRGKKVNALLDSVNTTKPGDKGNNSDKTPPSTDKVKKPPGTNTLPDDPWKDD